MGGSSRSPVISATDEEKHKALIIIVWAVLFLSCAGVGALVGRLFGARSGRSVYPFANFWVG